jgi:hypothetical protein
MNSFNKDNIFKDNSFKDNSFKDNKLVYGIGVFVVLIILATVIFLIVYFTNFRNVEGNIISTNYNPLPYLDYKHQYILNIEVKNNYNNKTESIILTKYFRYPLSILDEEGDIITLQYNPLFKIYRYLYAKSTIVVLKK